MQLRITLTLLLLLLVITPLFAQKIHATTVRSRTTESVDLPNFATVAPGIYRGAAPTEAGLRTLRDKGIHTVIDLRIAPRQVAKERAQAQALGLTWLNIPMGTDPPTSRQVATFLSTLKRAPTEPVFVHCQYGADRTGCMVGIWRVTQQGWSYPETYKEMRHYGFKPFLKTMAKSVEKRAARQTR